MLMQGVNALRLLCDRICQAAGGSLAHIVDNENALNIYNV